MLVESRAMNLFIIFYECAVVVSATRVRHLVPYRTFWWCKIFTLTQWLSSPHGGDILVSYRTVRCIKKCHDGAPMVRKTQIGHVGGIAHSKMILIM